MRSSLLDRFISHLRTHGLPETARKTVAGLKRRILQQVGSRSGRAIEQRRREISKDIAKRLNSTVGYGPFRGMKLTTEAWWGGSDRAAMLLGLYEQEILNELQKIPDRYRTFIDLGAADGYYGIGVLVSGRFSKSYCYELSEEGRIAISTNARLNNVLDQVIIAGRADKGFHKDIPAREIDNAVVLIDIEGDEFDLFDETVFRALRNSIIFIEIHDWIEDAETKTKSLREQARMTHTIKMFSTGARELSSFDEVRLYSDTDRWLICSEGRPRLMHWYRLDPVE